MSYKVWGTLEEGEAPGTVIGELRDEFGVVFILTGTLHRTTYSLEGVPGPTPEGCKLPWE
jgi:hypothetical protein